MKRNSLYLTRSQSELFCQHIFRRNKEGEKKERRRPFRPLSTFFESDDVAVKKVRQKAQIVTALSINTDGWALLKKCHILRTPSLKMLTHTNVRCAFKFSRSSSIALFEQSPNLSSVCSITQNGFTFIEVMVAMLIFTLAAVSAMTLVEGAVKSTIDTKEQSVATWLIQKVMVELETKIETQGFDKGCIKKKEGKFDEPYQNYSYITYCSEIKINLSQTNALLTAANPDADSEDTVKENQIQKLILDTASDYLGKSLREIHAEVYWMQRKNKRTVNVTTHVVRYDLPVQLPGLGALPSTAAPGQ